MIIILTVNSMYSLLNKAHILPLGLVQNNGRVGLILGPCWQASIGGCCTFQKELVGCFQGVAE